MIFWGHMWFLSWFITKVVANFNRARVSLLYHSFDSSLSNYWHMLCQEMARDIFFISAMFFSWLTTKKEAKWPGKHTHRALVALDSPWETRGCPSWFQSYCHQRHCPCHCRCRWRSISAGSSHSAACAEAHRTPVLLSHWLPWARYNCLALLTESSLRRSSHGEVSDRCHSQLTNDNFY